MPPPETPPLGPPGAPPCHTEGPPGTPTKAPTDFQSARKRRRKRDDPQSCFGLVAAREDSGDEIDMSPVEGIAMGSPPVPSPTLRVPSPHEPPEHHEHTSDVEQFEGKIVYNPDGSAYIIEDSDLSDDGSLAGLKDGYIVDGRGVPPPSSSHIPKIASAYYVSAPPTQHQQMAPMMHSFRVVSARDAGSVRVQTPVPVKPILMCFICKLSFGHAKAFSSHAAQDHSLELAEDERQLLGRETSSAIVQHGGDSQRPVVSFLEPLESPGMHMHHPSQVPTSIGDLQINSSLVRRSSTLPNNQVPSVSPRKSPSMSPPGMQQSPLAAMMAGTTIGACPEHLAGRPAGSECPRCELLLAASRLGSPQVPHSRNSCKTLKCPKCNWHYKYQETLEIHMKEKHPDGEAACAFCLAGQPHPRLARGETYTCGYKPYRCEVCNYSTTTKGNLSIHMQSDKHLNNMQELQAGGGGGGVPVVSGESPRGPSPKAPPPAAPHHSPVGSGGKPKPTFRCDVCSYETGVARNLRIHMTSEKHTHNMAVLQQNVKHLQALSALHLHHSQAAQMEGLMPQHNQQQPIPTAEAALADMAYSQALMIQLMTGGPMPGAPPGDLPPHLDLGLNPEAMEPPPEPADPEPHALYSCLVCSTFHTDSLEALGAHLAADRTRAREQEVLALIGGNYVCRLCSYKTNLKANFQLHCKTDKHLQRLQHVNHVKEGGARNEWKLKYPSAGAVQLRCHACDYYTNSAHKLQLHAAAARHEGARALFRHLGERLGSIPRDTPRSYLCSICGFRAPNKLPLLQHVRSMKHVQMEQLHYLQRRADGQESPPELCEIFQVIPEPLEPLDIKPDVSRESLDNSFTEQQVQSCPFCTFSCDSEARLQGHISAQHEGAQPEGAPSSPDSPPMLCPLCQDGFKERQALERHVMQIHSVNSEGLQRLLMLVDQSHWLNRGGETSPQSDESSCEPERCIVCPLNFKSHDELCMHQIDNNHLNTMNTPNGPQMSCPRKGCGQWFPQPSALLSHYRESHGPPPAGALVSERHVYKYRCNQCSLAFKTLEKLTAHSHYHAMRDATKCSQCGRGFRSAGALQRHIETAHGEDPIPEDDNHDDESEVMSEPSDDPQRMLEDYLNSPALAEEGYGDPQRKHKCHRCRVAFTSQAHLTGHNKSLQHRRGEKLAYPLEKFLDPNRPFKCEVCKESFTQKNILLVHYNSVSHLHKLKRAALQDNNNLPASPATPLTPQGAASPPEDDKKRFRCDICKVAYAQGSTLDIHMRSVLHQTRACRMQEANNHGEVSPPSPTPPPISPEIPAGPPSAPPSPASAAANLSDLQAQQAAIKKNPSQIYKTLLESFGFDLVMQYNEAKSASPPQQEALQEISEGPFTCQHCHKAFSSIFVLKTHCEEVHRDKVPLEFLEQFAEHFKTEYEKKAVVGSPEPDGSCNERGAPTPTTPPSTPASSRDTDSQPPNMQGQQLPMNLVNEMQAALNVMQFHPMMAQMMSMGLPLGLNMGALAAMNLQPPLVSMMMPPPPYDTMNMGGSQYSPQNAQDAQAMMAKQQAAMIQQQQANAANQKRARTRITDDQLKILRAHFDINNSPSEEAILEMANRSQLPPKVIKHWFRNTLFKERQRNKDSPYNFNNPPSTTLNLEEYEKTGEAKVTQLNSSGSSLEENGPNLKRIKISPVPAPTPIIPEIKSEPMDVENHIEDYKFGPFEPKRERSRSPAPSLSGSEAMPSRPQSPMAPHMTLGSLVQSQLDSIPTCTIPAMLPPRVTPQTFASPPGGPGAPPLTPDLSGGSSNGSSSSGGSGKRANRTRFTDYQIKVLQEFFENNAYPKDDDLEYLSKLLGLSPRVIVVWFQNARQKARKVYENQPAAETPPPGGPVDDPNRFQRTPGLNYQCKKCQLVFQRYYELIRHQKTHCFKEEDARRSAQAQAAAAQVAASLSSEDSNSSTAIDQNHQQMQSQQQINQQPMQQITPPAHTPPAPSPPVAATSFQCDKCQLVFPRFELWREHQLVHLMNPGLFPPAYPPDSPFGILQQLGGSPEPPGPKRKLDEYDLIDNEGSESGQPRDKRLRTTILPEQLDYLYQKYQQESNPSRKMLESIARDVGLKKRVVQVWFQNTRARERKGQFRAHAQVINKRCPFCPALFKVKSALETHLTAKHADQCARGEINIDALPDEEISMDSDKGGPMPPPPMFAPLQGLQDVEALLKRYGDDSMRRYLESVSEGTREGEIPLDLSKPMRLSLDGSDHPPGGPPTDLSEVSLSMSMSDSGDTGDFYDDEGGPISPASSTQSGRGGAPCKRYRTQMSALQVRIMKVLFNDFKTPSMAECEALGREVGLVKRVVQVWFQNARAKDKKARQARPDDTPDRSPEDCRICGVQYSHKLSLQEHVFSASHIAAVRAHLEGTPDTEFTVPPPPAEHQTNNLLLQMAAAAAKGLGGGAENQEALLQQLYGLAAMQGSAQSAGPQVPPFLPPMLGANVTVTLENGVNLRLPVTISEQLRRLSSIPGDSELRLPSGDSNHAYAPPSLIRELDLDLCYICKTCRGAFSGVRTIAEHPCGPRGHIKLVQTGYECRACGPGVKFRTLLETRRHCDSHVNMLNDTVRSLPPPESPLSHEMEDVVNQITLLAARAAKEATPVASVVPPQTQTALVAPIAGAGN